MDLVFQERFKKIVRLPVTKFTTVQIGCLFIFTMALNASFIMVYTQHYSFVGAL